MGFAKGAALVVLTAVAVTVLPGWLSSPPEMMFHGTTEKGWEPVAEAFK